MSYSVFASILIICDSFFLMYTSLYIVHHTVCIATIGIINQIEYPIGAIIGAVVGVLVVAVIAFIIWSKRHSCTRSMPEKQDTTTVKNAAVTNGSINNNNSSDYSGAFSRAIVTDNPRRNSSDRKSGSMLIDLDAGIVIDSVHDSTSANDDVECGTAALLKVQSTV
jgi:hypothetical protein